MFPTGVTQRRELNRSSKAYCVSHVLKLGDSVGKVLQLGVLAEVEVLNIDAVATATEVLGHSIQTADSHGKNAQEPSHPNNKSADRVDYVPGPAQNAAARELLQFPGFWPQQQYLHSRRQNRRLLEVRLNSPLHERL